MSEERLTLRSSGIETTIKAHGAELCSLKDAQGNELIWQAGTAWPRHAPLLFPIVGRLKNDQLRHQGATYPMTQHGFARDQLFEWGERDTTACSLTLRDSAVTRAHYPFAFRLAVTYRLQAADLDVTLAITNTGDEMLPASIGAHPAFNWPLVEGVAKESYRLTFSDQEPGPIRRLKDGLMRAKSEPSPIRGKTLALSEPLFDDDAIILDRLASRAVGLAANRDRRSMCPGSDFASWESGRSLAGRHFFASSRGVALRARPISTANLPTSPASCRLRQAQARF